MKKWKTYIPAIVVLLVCIGLIAYEFYTMPTEGPPHGSRPEGGFEGHGEHERSLIRELSNWAGTIAIIGGAIAYSWVRFKKQLHSKSTFIQKFSKKLFRLHNIMGWMILVLGTAHGIYFLVTEKLTHKGMLSGIAAFLLLLTIGLYGYYIRRVKNKYTRKVHFWLSNVALFVLLIHAGGQFILAALGTLIIWGILALIEKITIRKKVAAEKGATA